MVVVGTTVEGLLAVELVLVVLLLAEVLAVVEGVDGVVGFFVEGLVAGVVPELDDEPEVGVELDPEDPAEEPVEPEPEEAAGADEVPG